MSPDEDKNPLPTAIGRYEVQNLIAEGGMGHVYLARDPLVKRRVAVKLLKRLYTDDPGVRYRFEKEAEAVAGLEHPTIVPVYDFGEHRGQLYFVMRYVGGGTFRDRIMAGQVSLRSAAAVLLRVAEALDAAHHVGIVHRDIKPANILFDQQGEAYLSDFGIAKGNEGVEETGTTVLGTPQYLSPEQAQGSQIDGRSDVYSLGVVGYHAIAGRPPFEAPTPMAMAMAHVMTEPPSIRDFAPTLPPVANDVFNRVLAKDPADRYQSASGFAKDVHDIASGRWYLVKLAARTEKTAPPAREQPPPPAASAETVVEQTPVRYVSFKDDDQ